MRTAAAALLLSAVLCPARAQPLPVPPAGAEPALPLPAETDAVQAVPLLPGERLPLDGRLDHPAWRRAVWHSRFVEHAPRNGQAPAQATRFAVLYDRQALYVGVRADTPEPSALRSPLVRHDHVNRTQDFVAVYVDAVGGRQSAQFFRVNPAGATADGLHTAADDSEDFLPDFDWDAAAHRDAGGYGVVMRIPFSTLRFGGDGEPAWRLMVMRRSPRGQFTMDTSVAMARDAPSFIAAMPPLQGLRLPAHGQFLSVRPSLTLRHTGGGPEGAQTRWQPALDLKWRPLPELVVDAALRPDFSQVALDVPQLSGNTRYAIFRDEKRPFFYESSDLLRSPSDALYTRSFTEPQAGLRATWRGSGLAGTLMAVADRGGGVVLLPGSFGTGELEQPASQALAGRLVLDPSRGAAGLPGHERLQLGAVGAWRRYADGRGENVVAGPDATWHPVPAWRLRAQWLGARSTALPDGQGELVRGPAQQGQRRLLKASYTSLRHEFEAQLDDVDRGFRHDTGFVGQSGVRKAWARYARGWQALGPLNDFWLNVETSHDVQRGSGLLVSRDLWAGFWLTGPHNLEAWAYWHGDAAQRTGEGQPLLRERYLKGAVQASPAGWLPRTELRYTVGRLADVVENTVRPGAELRAVLQLRPLPWLELEPDLKRAWLEQDGQRRYDEGATQLLAIAHLDARQTLRLILQDLHARRLGGDTWAARIASLTYGWRPSAGTALYVGASQQDEQGVVGGAPQAVRGHELFVKLQLDAEGVAAWAAPLWRPRRVLRP